MKNLLDFQKGMRAVTLNSEFSLCGLIIFFGSYCVHGIRSKIPYVLIIKGRQRSSLVPSSLLLPLTPGYEADEGEDALL